MNKRLSLLLLVLLAAGMLLAGCEAQDKAVSSGPDSPITLCGSCGQVKGCADCCKPGAELCEKCGLAKGSPGCCNITKGADVTLAPDDELAIKIYKSDLSKSCDNIDASK